MGISSVLAHADVRSAPGRSSGGDVDAAAGSMRQPT
jgi:hypothetical protein